MQTYQNCLNVHVQAQKIRHRSGTRQAQLHQGPGRDMLNALIDMVMVHPEIVAKIPCRFLPQSVPDVDEATAIERTSDDQSLQGGEPFGLGNSESFTKS